MTKDLLLKWTQHPGTKYKNRKYLDFLVSGQPLREYLGITNDSGVTPFGFFPNEKEQKRALKEFRLQEKTHLTGNRIELYICECCGDIGCGAITAKISDTGEKIIWSHFASQNNPEEIGEEILVDQIEFDRQNYFKAFSVLGDFASIQHSALVKWSRLKGNKLIAKSNSSSLKKTQYSQLIVTLSKNRRGTN